MLNNSALNDRTHYIRASVERKGVSLHTIK
jgi:hypothetical protein